MSEWGWGGLTEKVTLKQIPGVEGMHQKERGGQCPRGKSRWKDVQLESGVG